MKLSATMLKAVAGLGLGALCSALICQELLAQTVPTTLLPFTRAYLIANYSAAVRTDQLARNCSVDSAAIADFERATRQVFFENEEDIWRVLYIDVGELETSARSAGDQRFQKEFIGQNKPVACAGVLEQILKFNRAIK